MAKNDYRKNKGNGKKNAATTTQYRTTADLHKEWEQRRRDLDELEKAMQIAKANEQQTADAAAATTKSGDKPRTAAEWRAFAEEATRKAKELEAAEAAERDRLEAISNSAGYTGPQKGWMYRDRNGKPHVVLSYLIALGFSPQPVCVPVWVKNGRIERVLDDEECDQYDF